MIYDGYSNTRLKSAQRSSRNTKHSILSKSKLIVNSPWVEHLCHSCRKGSRSVKWGQTDRWRRSGAVSRGGQRLQRLASSPSHTHSWSRGSCVIIGAGLTLQSMIDALLSQQRFWPCYMNEPLKPVHLYCGLHSAPIIRVTSYKGQ